MAQNVMRRAGQAAVATGVAAAVSLQSDNTIHAEEINDVARVVFCSSQSLQSINAPLHQSRGLRVSSDPAIHEALVKLGSRIASNPAIQQLVQEEVGDWLLVNSVPGGPPIHAIKEEESQSMHDQSMNQSVRRAFAAELDQLNEEDFRILSEKPVNKPLSHAFIQPIQRDEDVSEPVSTPRGSSERPMNPSTSRSTSLIEQVFDWIQDKLASVVGLFTHHSASTVQAENQSQHQSNPEAQPIDDNEPGQFSSSSNPSIQPSPRFTAAAVGIAAVLIVLVTCRRFSPALFRAAVRLIH